MEVVYFVTKIFPINRYSLGEQLRQAFPPKAGPSLQRAPSALPVGICFYLA